ncbi:hypothetical protein JH06_3532 [Blastocystis sp. subtype 4]|uniref:hypothetical protein n=1 Tax=Blastocystis sp. subtype 4 TaxID=944170 RepID=UPI000711F855|nr:hypothetical protein JH06_3532 [Blastocystis sp. subtype 4]KNB42773.1 hypothetical protein JH06_3532 [Blastocystis sp. subtype 4]|eukprot:XP_014526216.1 hypothetical protein JH06_3532 [Blastocystis sp. subtype 4]
MSGYSVISEVFIGDPVNFRKDIFECWLDQLSVDDATKKIKKEMENESMVIPRIDELIHEDILDSYRIFDFFKEQLFVNSWSIRYFELDDTLVREIVSIGIGERKRSIIKTTKTPSLHAMELVEGVKVMLEYIQSYSDHKSLVLALQLRFHINQSLARSYLSLLYLLLDNRDVDSIRNRPYMEWSVVNVHDTIWFMLSNWTQGLEDMPTTSVIASAPDICKGVKYLS